MQVLVTGAGGFIGQHLVQRLSCDGYQVRASVRRLNPQTVFPAGVEVVEGDVRDRSAMKAVAARCEIIFHLAGKAHAIRERHTDERDYQTVNVEGTRNVLEGGIAGGVRRVVCFSTVKVFGEGTSGCVDESVLPAPATPYGQSKWAAEQLVMEYGRKEALATTSLRLPLVYGPNHKGNLSRMMAAIDRGRFPPLPRVANVRSMLHVENLVQAALLAARSQTSLRPSYIVTDARPYSITEIYESLCQGLGRPAPRWRVPLWMLKAVARGGDLVEAIMRRPCAFSTVTLDKLIGPAWYSSDAISHDLGYRPTVTFADAVPGMVASYRHTCV